MISLRGLVLAALLCGSGGAGAANIVLQNGNAPGEGFNDPTPVQPVGGNSGTTLGQQRLIAMQFAADLLGQRLVSAPDILLNARFEPLECGSVENTGFTTLGAAGPSSFILFESAPPAGARVDVFYPIALANALNGSDLSGGPEIFARFNSEVDNSSCLGNIDWYYGLDGNAGDDISFIETAVHELIHGLGFLTITDLNTGAFPTLGDGLFAPTFPDIYATFIFDVIQGASWPDLLAPQRIASARNDGNVVWVGPNTTANAAPTLEDGVNRGNVQLYAPVAMEEGSSISHWDTAVTPDALMEPFASEDVSVLSGIGISACLLQDIGWQLTGVGPCPDNSGNTPGTPGLPGDDGRGATQGGGGGTAVLANSSSGGGGGSGGGGCALGAKGMTDPLWILLFAGSLLLRRRRRLDLR